MGDGQRLVDGRAASGAESRAARGSRRPMWAAPLACAALILLATGACSELQDIPALDGLLDGDVSSDGAANDGVAGDTEAGNTEAGDTEAGGGETARGSGPTAADVPEGAHEGLSDELVAELAAEGFEVDLTAMTALPCHAMFDIIMGDCTAEDVRRVADEVLAQRGERSAAAEVEPPPAADFMPGDLDPRLASHARRPTTVLDLSDGARIEMSALVTDWEVDDIRFRGYGYNAEVPGPLIKVRQGSSITVDFENGIDLPTTIHWHGLRHDNAHDGVPGVTQPTVKPGERWEYVLEFPDAGIYWYHPHVREDIQQDAGMYGVMLVEPSNPRYYNPVDREEILILDDVFVEDGRPVPYGNDHTNFAIMGRFGNRMLVNGRDGYTLSVAQGEVVRFHVANVSNVRPFRLTFDGAPMRLVGSDLGKYVIEDFVDGVLIAPAERYTVEVLFEEGRNYRLLNRTPEQDYAIGAVLVTPGDHDGGEHAEIFRKRRLNAEVLHDIERFREHFDRAPDAEIVIDVQVDGLVLSARAPSEDAGGAEAQDDARDEDHDEGAREPDTEDHDDEGEDDHSDGGVHAPIEWEDEMLAANRQAFGERDVRWIIRDVESGAENHDLAYVYEVGDAVKMRWINDPDSPHPMQHPIHIHGQRFLVTAIDGVPVPDEDLVWKDTFLMPIGATMDIVMDVTNPGAWMVHCHIAEHLETGMMYQFIVTD